MDNSWSDSDVVRPSISESRILVPDSDTEETNQTKSHNPLEVSTMVVLSSDDEDIGCSNDTSKKSGSSFNESLILSSKKKTYHIIESDEDSEDGIKSSVVGDRSHSHKKSINADIEDEIPIFHENVFSSTRLSDNDNKSPSFTNTSNKSNLYKSNNTELRKPLNTSSKLPTIDLTNLDNRNEYRNIAEDTSDDDDDSDNRKVVIDSESEDDKLENKTISGVNEIEIVSQLNSLTLPSSSNKSKSEPQNNDYLTRVESLKAEEVRLKEQVSGVLKTIDTIKTTLRTANLAALPDKGVRLQMSLKKAENKLRELRYQQGTLSNELIKLQMTSKSRPTVKQEPDRKFIGLPTLNTDTNVMGKKALETHRTQQALTVDALRTLHNSLKNCPNEDTHVADPKGLSVALMPHQKHALAWMVWREKEKPSGGILADDMGLGKTLTMISLILKSYEEREQKDSDEESDGEDDDDDENKWMSSKRDKLIPGKTLVVCPASLIGQWENEIKNKVSKRKLDVVVHHGTDREKKPRRLARPDVVITTYSILPREASSQGPLYGIRWERVILDEGHQIRNHKTKTAQSVYQLKAKHRWVLTGTPVHNKEIDLYSLLKFLRCSPFDDLTVWKRWVDNRDAAGIQRLNTITKSLMLRRTKEGLLQQGQLASLKEKEFHTIFTSLDKEEQSAYEKLLTFSATLFAQFLHQKAERNNALPGMALSSKSSKSLRDLDNPFQNHPDLARLHRQMKQVSDIKSHHILVLLLRLRQFCSHPALITTMFEKDEIAKEGIEDSDGLDLDLIDQLTRMSLAPSEREKEADEAKEEDAAALSTQNPLFNNDRLGSKMKKVLKTLEDILNTDNDKAVVVSQWVSLLEVIHKVLKEKKIKCLSLNGTVPVKDRAEIVERFNQKGRGPRVILLSLTAGGVGLNLVGGNHLLLLDLHWNPQLESQACDRIYRVGQEKNVQIYKFVVSDTIEERILNLQKSKLEMATAILTGSKHTTKLSLDDLKMLFQVK